MIDIESAYVYYTPVFYILAQCSRSIRAGDKAVQIIHSSNEQDPDDLYAFASINELRQLSIQLLNTTKNPVEFNLQIDAQYAAIRVPANALQTIRVQL